MRFLILFMSLFFFVVCLNGQHLQAQDQDSSRVIQFSGVIVDQETLEPIIGVHVFSPRYGKGATTDYFGKYSFAIKEGDSILITAIGYERRTVEVPFLENKTLDKFTTLVELKPETTYLEEIEINPFPTEQLFKDAILAMNPSSSTERQNLNKATKYITSMQLYKGIPRSQSAQYREALATQELDRKDNYEARTFVPLNPKDWVKLIRSLRKK